MGGFVALRLAVRRPDPQPISGLAIAEATGGKYGAVAAAGHSVALEQPECVAEHLLGHFATVLG